jgi:hypothetical protein
MRIDRKWERENCSIAHESRSKMTLTREWKKLVLIVIHIIYALCSRLFASCSLSRWTAIIFIPAQIQHRHSHFLLTHGTHSLTTIDLNFMELFMKNKRTFVPTMNWVSDCLELLRWRWTNDDDDDVEKVFVIHSTYTNTCHHLSFPLSLTHKLTRISCRIHEVTCNIAPAFYRLFVKRERKKLVLE